MSESELTLAQLASAALPVVAKEVEGALAPEAEKVLGDLREFVAGEADKLRQELPAAVENGVAHLHALGEAMLARYHSVMDRIDAHLGGSAPAPVAVPTPTPAADSSAPTSTASASTAPAADSSSAPVGGPTQAAVAPQSTSTDTSTSQGSSESSVTPSEATAPAPTTDTPAV